MEIAERLRDLRERRNLSGRAAATYLGISSAHVSDMENGKAKPSLELLTRLAGYYHTSADYLLGLTDDPSPRRGAALPAPVREVVQLAAAWPEARQQELLDVALVMEAAERDADLREYDRIMGLLAAVAEGDIATEALETVLRAHAAGDRAEALRLVEAFFAGRDAREETQKAKERRDA